MCSPCAAHEQPTCGPCCATGVFTALAPCATTWAPSSLRCCICPILQGQVRKRNAQQVAHKTPWRLCLRTKLVCCNTAEDDRACVRRNWGKGCANGPAGPYGENEIPPRRCGPPARVTHVFCVSVAMSETPPGAGGGAAQPIYRCCATGNFYSMSTMRENLNAKFTALLHLPRMKRPGSHA